MGEKVRILGVSGVAVGLGGFAVALGLCCGVPWVVAVLGVSGAIAFARLDFLLPHVLLGAAVLLGVGFWLAYRPKAACADGNCAPDGRGALRRIVWPATALVGALTAIALGSRI